MPVAARMTSAAVLPSNANKFYAASRARDRRRNVWRRPSLKVSRRSDELGVAGCMAAYQPADHHRRSRKDLGGGAGALGDPLLGTRHGTMPLADQLNFELTQGKLHRFADWPNQAVPTFGAGVYTIWHVDGGPS
jgi:hypothetical protein